MERADRVKPFGGAACIREKLRSRDRAVPVSVHFRDENVRTVILPQIEVVVPKMMIADVSEISTFSIFVLRRSEPRRPLRPGTGDEARTSRLSSRP
jgi:hypothetical protein